MNDNLKLPSLEAGLVVHAAFFDVHPELIAPGYLNNLPEKFDPRYREQQMIAANVGRDNQRYTELRRSLSPQDFIHLLDASAERVGMDVALFLQHKRELDALFEMALKKGRAFAILGGTDKKLEAELVELDDKTRAIKGRRDPIVIPVYLDLHKQGFNHYDLVG